MRKRCDACGKFKKAEYFYPVEGGEHYKHLGFKRVCNLCQVKDKGCACCGKNYPANTQWFYRKLHGLYGLHSYCIKCCSTRAAHIHAVRQREKAVHHATTQ